MIRFAAYAIAVALLVGGVGPVSADDATGDPSLVRKASPYSVTETLDRVVAIIERRGGRVFARIDHARGAESIFEELRPTETLIFGNPKAGTPLMQANQEMGLDLPIRLLAYETESGEVLLVYRHPAALAEPHGIASDRRLAIERIADTLNQLTDAAVASE